MFIKAGIILVLGPVSWVDVSMADVYSMNGPTPNPVSYYITKSILSKKMLINTLYPTLHIYHKDTKD